MPKNVYQRFADRIAADPGYPLRAATPPPQIADFAWLAGDWTWEMQIHATPTTPARVAKGVFTFVPDGSSIWMHSGSSKPIPYLTYDAFQGRWVLTLVDKLSHGGISGPGWQDGTAVFEGMMTFMGVEMHLRQTWRRISEGELRNVNEELLEGQWIPVDEIIIKRVVA